MRQTVFKELLVLFSNQKHIFVSRSCDTGICMVMRESNMSFMDWTVHWFLVTSANKYSHFDT